MNISEVVTSIFVFVMLVFVVIGLACLTPLLVLWAINTLFELSGSSYYIPHNVLSYVAVIVIFSVLRPSNYTK